ncbi:MAG: RidA family protein [Pseudomonadota bacterium]
MDDSQARILYPKTDRLPQAWASRFAYSYAVRTGELVWISGQIARNAAGELVGQGDIRAQAVQVFENIKAAVEAAGGTMADVVSTTTYITERPQREVVTEIRHGYFPGPDHPCNTLLIVSGLGLPEYLVEIEAVAWVRR